MLHEGGGGATTGLRECRYTDPPGSRGGGVAATGRGLTLLAHEISLLHPLPSGSRVVWYIHVLLFTMLSGALYLYIPVNIYEMIMMLQVHYLVSIVAADAGAATLQIPSRRSIT